LYKQEFEKLLQNSLPSVVLLYGENHFFLDYYSKLYKERLNAKEELLEHFFDDYNFEQAKAYLSQGSLFGGTNLYILRSNKKPNKKELEALIQSCSKNPDNYFLYLYEGSSSDAKSLTTTFSKKNGAIAVRFFEANMREAIDFGNKIARELNLNITPYALNYLITTLNLNLALIAKELEKLAILQTPIEISHIDSLVYSTAPLGVEKMIISLFKKEETTKTINMLIELGEDIYSILRSIQRFVQQLFLFHAYIKLNGKPNSKEILGYALPKWIEEERASLAVRIKPAKLLKIYQELLELELNLKQTSGNKEAIFFGAIAKLRAII
jgi:DNA polymerase-3 subunit delta